MFSDHLELTVIMAVTRTLIRGGGGGDIHISLFYPTDFFLSWSIWNWLEKNLVGQKMNRDLKIYNATGSTMRFEFQLENEP